MISRLSRNFATNVSAKCIIKRRLSCGGLHSTEMEQVLRMADVVAIQLYAGDATEACATKLAPYLSPPEDPLDSFAYPAGPTDSITSVSGYVGT